MPQSHGIPHKCGDMPGNGANFKLRQQRVQEWLGIVQKQRFRALGQFEPDIIRERTRAGLDAVMARRARSNGLGNISKACIDTFPSLQPLVGAQMSHAIIRGKSGRRHEVDFEGSALRVEVYAGDETVEIFVEADTDELPEERRRFALINIPRHLFSQATAEAAKRKNERLR